MNPATEHDLADCIFNVEAFRAFFLARCLRKHYRTFGPEMKYFPPVRSDFHRSCPTDRRGLGFTASMQDLWSFRPHYPSVPSRCGPSRSGPNTHPAPNLSGPRSIRPHITKHKICTSIYKPCPVRPHYCCTRRSIRPTFLYTYRLVDSAPCNLAWNLHLHLQAMSRAT